jgi:hypothetical protein
MRSSFTVGGDCRWPFHLDGYTAGTVASKVTLNHQSWIWLALR